MYKRYIPNSLSHLCFRIREHLKQEQLIRDDDNKEGDELKRLNAQYEMEKSRLDEIRKAEAKQLLTDNIQQIGDVQKMKDFNRMQEEVWISWHLVSVPKQTSPLPYRC